MTTATERPPLTSRQQDVLMWISGYIDTHDYPPDCAGNLQPLRVDDAELGDVPSAAYAEERLRDVGGRLLTDAASDWR
jgi:hypothetical protein